MLIGLITLFFACGEKKSEPENAQATEDTKVESEAQPVEVKADDAVKQEIPAETTPVETETKEESVENVEKPVEKTEE